ncbi:MAG: hypothetical protein JSV96_10125 [Candidatus Aminicenantes bacterium]|nr:MAG: hypothetical protein JSV96_10125 [Candidatus Aminicenantes bacterium]
MAVNITKSIPRKKKAQSDFPSIEIMPEFKDLKKLGLDFLDETDSKTRDDMEDLFVNYADIANFTFGEGNFRSNLFNLFVEYFCMSRALPLKELIGGLERSLIMRALSRFNGSQKDAAKFLGVKYTTLNEKIKKHHICFRKAPYKYI